jgi:superfamily II DNA helicase RecQ
VALRYQDQQLGRQSKELSGLTLVISPLIALMKDQVDALLRRGIKAAVLNSSLTRDQYLTVQDDLRNGRLDMIYCAPERLNSEGFIASLKDIPGGIRLLAVDEAHCISEWGHSFRPDYLKIARFAQEAAVERVVCLTATATAQVSVDIRNAFSIPLEGLFRTAMYRPNLRLLAEANPKDCDYKGKLVEHLKKYPGPSIVYVTLQKSAETLAEHLQSLGFKAQPYHAGMTAQVRSKTQDEFLSSCDMIVVATIAFGMGIDKPDIRSIVHFDIPDSIESYSQQIGRAGRDGKPSVCMFFLSTKDRHLRNIFTYGDRPSQRSLRLLMEDICSPERKRLKAGETFKLSLHTQAREVDIKATVLSIIYAQLELHFKLFRAAGTLYNKYKYIVNDRNIVMNDSSPAATIILRASVKSSRWTHVALDELASSTGILRADLVRKLDDWNGRGAIQLEKEGVQNIFRLEQALPSSPEAMKSITEQLDRNMKGTEQQNLARTQALLHLMTDQRCFAHAIAGYFGEGSSNMPEECGHCTWCETHTQVVLPNEPPQPPDPLKVKKLLEKVSVRDDPRFLAKIAFGIKSPRITALKIFNTGVFDSMNVCDFNELLNVFTLACNEGIGLDGEKHTSF